MYNTSKYFILILMLIECETLYDPRVHSRNIPQCHATQYAQPDKKAKELCKGPSSAQVGPSFIGYTELHCQHHRTKIHCLALTVAIRLDFGGYSWSHCHGQPHQFIPCLTGGEVNSQLIEVGDDLSSRAIVSLMVQCPRGWPPTVLYARHCQVYISFTPKGMH